MARHGMLSIAGREQTEKVMKVSLGQECADLAIINATILNVYTGELLKGHSVTIKGEWIAYVGDDPRDSIGPTTQVIDARGKTVVPGLIDGHTHLADGFYTVSEFLKYAMPGGTTTIITETIEPFSAMGREGIVDFMDSIREQPVKIYATVSPLVSTSNKVRGISTEVLKELLTRDEVVGLGEAYWQGVIQEPDRYLPIFEQALEGGARLEGHSAGAKGEKLMAYLVPGISSCHEPINASEVLERLRMGMRVMVREGSIRGDLAAISKIKDTGVDLRRLILVSDGIKPVDLMNKGYMEWIVQEAIRCGFDPIQAIQMATINVAEHFRLDDIIGGIAPGKYADVLIIPSPNTVKAEYVISKGRIIAREGKLVVSPRKHGFSALSLKSVHLSRALEPVDFSIAVTEEVSQVKVRVIEQVTDLVTKELLVSVPIIDGKIRADATKDIAKVAAIDRRFDPGKIFVGLIRGFRLKTGAFATSTAWDTPDIIVVGENDADMAGAVNRVHALQGGIVVCANGDVIAEIPLPIFGLIADVPMSALVRRIEEIKRAVRDLGAPFEDPLLTLMTLTTAAIPFLRICDEGFVDLKDGKTMGLIVPKKP
jgi:adenine deaminase